AAPPDSRPFPPRRSPDLGSRRRLLLQGSGQRSNLGPEAHAGEQKSQFAQLYPGVDESPAGQSGDTAGTALPPPARLADAAYPRHERLADPSTLADQCIGLMQLASDFGRCTNALGRGAGASQLVRVMTTEQTPVRALDLLGLGILADAQQTQRLLIAAASRSRLL